MTGKSSIAATVVAALVGMLWMAGSAVATNYTTTDTSVPDVHATLATTATKTHEFLSTGGAALITCTGSVFSGTSTGKDTKVALEPGYSGCKDSIGRTAHVVANGCKYEAHATAGSAPTFTGTWAISCEGGKSVEWRITNSVGSVVCTFAVTTQEGLTSAHFENKSTTDIVLTLEAANLKNTSTGGVLNCGTLNGLHENGTYKGGLTVTAKDAGGQAIDGTMN
jgi:hypothetical protein